jgi:hypothetical protein
MRTPDLAAQVTIMIQVKDSHKKARRLGWPKTFENQQFTNGPPRIRLYSGWAKVRDLFSIIISDSEINRRAQDTVICIEREILKYHIIDGESVRAAAGFVELKIRIPHAVGRPVD